MRPTILSACAITISIALASKAFDQQGDSKKTPVPAVDAFGDPLPPGAVARLGTVRWRHGSPTAVVVYSPDGKVVASAGGTHVAIKLWDPATGRTLHELLKPRGTPSVAFSPDSKLFVLAEYEFLCLYDVATAKEIRRLNGLTKCWLSSVAFCSDGKTVAAAGEDGTSEKALIVLWDAITGKELHRFQGQSTYEQVVAFSPDGKLLASGGRDGCVRLWDVATGKVVHELKGHGDGVGALAFAPSANVLASAGEDGVGRVWDVVTGKITREIKPENARVDLLAYSPDGKLLVTSGMWDGATLRLWDTDTGKEIRHWTANGQRVSAVTFSPDGNVITSAGGYDHAIRHWDTATAKEINPAQGHTGSVLGPMVFSPDSKKMLSCGADKRVVEWDIATGKELRQVVSGSLSPAEAKWTFAYQGLSADGKTLARTGRMAKDEKPEFSIRLWDLAAQTEHRVLDAHTGQVTEMKFSPDGKSLASYGKDGLRLWDLPTGKELYHLPAFGGGAFSPDGKLLALTGLKDKAIWLIEAATRKWVRRWDKPGGFIGLVFSSDGTRLAATGGDNDPVCIWDVATGKELMRFSGHLYVGSLGYSPSGRVLAGDVRGNKKRSSWDAPTIYLWDAWTGEEIRHFETPQGWLWSMTFAPDGRLLATGGDDSTILLWDMTGQLESGPAKPAALSGKELAELWSDLISTAPKADKAIWKLAFSSSASLPFIKERLQLSPPADEKLVAKLVATLESERYADRQKAFQDLEKLGESAESAVRKHMEGKITLEARQRLQQFLDNRGKEVIRKLRAAETLEHIGSTEARQVLAALAGDSPSPRVTEFATAALARLAKRGN